MGTLSIGVGALVAAVLLSALTVRRRSQIGWQILAGVALAVVIWKIADARGAFEDREGCSDCGWGEVAGLFLLVANSVCWALGIALGGSIGLGFRARNRPRRHPEPTVDDER